MTAAGIITHLYSLVGLAIIIGYIPQILRLVTSTGRSLAISVSSFAVWGASACISLAYGLVVLQDWRFCVIETANVLGYLIIITLTLYNRYLRFPSGTLPGDIGPPLPPPLPSTLPLADKVEDRLP